jgi:hypothetical protein
MLDGAHCSGIVRTREEAILSGLSAVLSFSIETGGANNEIRSFSDVQTTLNDLIIDYSEAIKDGGIAGKSTGGFNRQR